MKRASIFITVGYLACSIIGTVAHAQTHPQKNTGSTKNGSVSDVTQQNQLTLKQSMEKKSQFQGMISNTMKQNSKTQQNVIKNMR
jgi:hypothetical protein